MTTAADTLRWQFELAWKLAQIHLPTLTDEMCLWEPAPGSWTVRRAADGKWVHDWAEVEPDPAPPVTIGWVTWQMIWWWSGLLAAMRGEKPAAHYEIAWPGSASSVVRRLEGLAAEWEEVLAKLTADELEKPLAYPWSEPKPLRLTIAWANSELMKNVAEIGSLRHLYEASRRG
ncbi:MAG: DinB family protein [Alphaproteobacteria bacterium]